MTVTKHWMGNNDHKQREADVSAKNIKNFSNSTLILLYARCCYLPVDR